MAERVDSWRLEKIVQPRDRLEGSVRFGCGFAFGCTATAAGLLASIWNGRYALALILVMGLSCGYAAMRFGDDFWAAVRRWWWP
jgi:hypothetical protein